ncbi:MAG: hypothetical protein WA861_09445, partial [Candidatus Binatus sp.]
ASVESHSSERLEVRDRLAAREQAIDFIEVQEARPAAGLPERLESNGDAIDLWLTGLFCVCEQNVKLQSAKCDAVTAKIPADARRTMKEVPDACVETLRLIDECKATLDHDCDQFTRGRDAVKDDLRRAPLTDIAANSCEQTRIMQENQLQNW